MFRVSGIRIHGTISSILSSEDRRSGTLFCVKATSGTFFAPELLCQSFTPHPKPQTANPRGPFGMVWAIWANTWSLTVTSRRLSQRWEFPKVGNIVP